MSYFLPASAPIGALTAVGLALMATLPKPTPAGPPTAISTAGEAIHVIDGDTADIGGQRYRLVGYDTPEIWHARCGRERDLGILAAAALIGMLRAGAVDVARTTGREKWGRGLARLTVAGQDVADSMIASSHARAYDGRSRRQGWCK
ncbi:MAG: thermonuclease family protein [Hyphomicrobiaceae bacterium]|nr:thermonuclease family protein [Hyphomicrobiaceae bacterium]